MVEEMVEDGQKMWGESKVTGFLFFFKLNFLIFLRLGKLTKENPVVHSDQFILFLVRVLGQMPENIRCF